MPNSSEVVETLHAACRAAAAGGFVVGAVPRGVTSSVNGGVGIYLLTLPAANAIDITNAVTIASTTIINGAVATLQASDLTVGVLGFTASTGAALDLIFNFAMWRTAVGPG